MNTSMKVSTLALAVAAASHVAAQESGEQIEEVIVVSQATTFANTVVSDSMKLQNSAITSVNDLIDNLPGVSVQEGDAFGFDDWSTAKLRVQQPPARYPKRGDMGGACRRTCGYMTPQLPTHMGGVCTQINGGTAP